MGRLGSTVLLSTRCRQRSLPTSNSEDLEVSPERRQRLLPDVRQRFSTACHSVSPWRPALEGWTVDHGDEMKSVRYCPVRFSSVHLSSCGTGKNGKGHRRKQTGASKRRRMTAVVSSSTGTARGTDGNCRLPTSISRRCPTAYSATCRVASHR